MPLLLSVIHRLTERSVFCVFVSDPNAIGADSSHRPPLDRWPLHSAATKSYLTLSVNSSAVGVGLKTRRCAFWLKHLPNIQEATGKKHLASAIGKRSNTSLALPVRD